MLDVVVSGIGIVSPLGTGREKTWSQLLNGTSAIHNTPDGLEALVIDFSPNGARSRMGDFALLAAEEAMIDAGFPIESTDDRNFGCAVSQSKPLLTGHTPAVIPVPRHRPSGMTRAPSPSNVLVEGPTKTFGNDECLDPALLLSSFFGWSAESLVRSKFKLTGPSSNVVAACATGVTSIQLGAQWIRSGQCDVVLVGASESSLHPLYRAGFRNMGVLSEGTTPQSICPFDKKRNGFAMGEGAAVLVLESAASAKLRGHRPLAKLLGASTMQGYSAAVRFGPEPTSISRLIKNVLHDFPVDYINAHGTATVLNDAAEAKGIRHALGNAVNKTAVSSTKAATGHLLGAAGAIEAAFAVLSIRDQKIPPTLNFSEADPECDLDCVPNTARAVSAERAMSLSFGFGGQMGAVVFERLS